MANRNLKFLNYSLSSLLSNIKFKRLFSNSTANFFVENTLIKYSNKTNTKTNILSTPNLEGQLKDYSPKIQNLVDEISKLNLIEVSDLNDLLKKKLNIKDTAFSFANISNFGQSPASQQVLSQKAEAEQEESLPKVTKSSFKLKLIKFDETKKVALIKEIKSLGDNMNLVQAKKFVESLPQVFKDNIGKEDADKLKVQLEKVGAVCEIE